MIFSTSCPMSSSNPPFPYLNTSTYPSVLSSNHIFSQEIFLICYHIWVKLASCMFLEHTPFSFVLIFLKEKVRQSKCSKVYLSKEWLANWGSFRTKEGSENSTQQHGQIIFFKRKQMTYRSSLFNCSEHLPYMDVLDHSSVCDLLKLGCYDWLVLSFML